MSACRSCDAEIIWTETANGKKMPVDAEPSDEGSFMLEGVDPPTAHFVKPEERSQHGELHESHFSTCPDADQHRKKP